MNATHPCSIAVGEQGLIVASVDGLVWSRVTQADLRSVHHAQNRFVAVGTNATILESPDGVNWNRTLPD